MSGADVRSLPDCFEGDPELLPVAEASRRIEAMVSPVAGSERVALRAALGRVLAAPVISPLDVPGHTNSAMDGYALAGADLPSRGERRLRVLGTAWAGRPFDGDVPAGAAVKIMTGAVMPRGTDTVIMQEHASADGDAVVVGAGHKAGQHVRLAGEDIERGGLVLPAGKRILPAELGLLGSLGATEITVRRRPRVVFFSTGDELRSLGEALAPGHVYDSNRYTLYGMLTRLGVDLVDMGVVRDDAAALRDALEEAAVVGDAVITSGGASTGEADYIREMLQTLGEVHFWRIALRPGRPIAFGTLRDALFFGLPGNPVAVMVTYYLFVQPALRRMMGETQTRPEPLVRATCTVPLRKRPGRVEVYRAKLSRDPEGRLAVRSTGKTGSGLLHTMSDADCFIVLPEDGESVEAGTEVDVVPFFGLA